MPLPGEGTPLAMIRVAPARPSDVLALTELLEEMDRFYGAAGGPSREERMRQTSEALFSDPAAAHVLLAWDGPQLAGMAAYSYLWPAVGRTRSLYLKELYIGESHRRGGVGKVWRSLEGTESFTARSLGPVSSLSVMSYIDLPMPTVDPCNGLASGSRRDARRCCGQAVGRRWPDRA